MSGVFALGKRAIQRAVVSGPGFSFVSGLREPRASIFTLHRFSDPELGSVDADPSDLSRRLERIRRLGVDIVSLSALVALLEEGRAVEKPTVVFTVDDGYGDFAAVGSPVFAAYDCPVTVFLISRFVDGGAWCWWDRIEVALRDSPRPSVGIELGSGHVEVALGSPRERAEQTTRMVELLKTIPDRERRTIVASIGDLCEVALPDVPPPRYSAMDWDQVRALESDLVTFGPHTRTHPILARTPDAVAVDEIEGSWSDVARECRAPLPVFCYPNGTPDAYSRRDVQLVRGAGLRAAVTTRDDYAQGTKGDGRFYLPRFSWPHDALRSVVVAAGIAGTEPFVHEELSLD